MSTNASEPVIFNVLSQEGPPVPIQIPGEHRDDLRQNLRDSWRKSVVKNSPFLEGSSFLADALEEDPHIKALLNADMLEPVLMFACSDGLIVVGGLVGGPCEIHGHPNVAWSMVSLPQGSIPEELQQARKVGGPSSLTIEQTKEVINKMSFVFQGFFLFHLELALKAAGAESDDSTN